MWPFTQHKFSQTHTEVQSQSVVGKGRVAEKGRRETQRESGSSVGFIYYESWLSKVLAPLSKPQ